jgi:hypothetical protein
MIFPTTNAFANRVRAAAAVDEQMLDRASPAAQPTAAAR